MRRPDRGNPPVHSVGPIHAGCNYGGGEIIAILIGFLLGIVPGIILLFLLC